MTSAIEGTRPFTPKELKAARKAWKRSRPKRPRVALDCVRLGEPITPQAASDLGLNPVRNWRPCSLGHGIKGHVCQCNPGATCRGCPDYSAATVDEDAATRRQPVDAELHGQSS